MLVCSCLCPLYLTEEDEHAIVELQQMLDRGDRSGAGVGRAEQQVPVQSSPPLLGPHINLLLAEGKHAGLPKLTAFLQARLQYLWIGGKGDTAINYNLYEHTCE